MKQETQGIDVKLFLIHRVAVDAHKRRVIWGITQACSGSYTNAFFKPCKVIQKSAVISVTHGLVSLSGRGTTCKVPIEITNLGDEPICIELNTRLGRIANASSVVSSLPSDQHSTCREKDQQNPETGTAQPYLDKQSNRVDPDLLTVLKLEKILLNSHEKEKRPTIY